MAQANILIVEDTPQNSAFLTKILAQKYQVRSFESGKTALQAAQSGWADVILLDTKLPDINGYEMCRLLKASQKTHAIRVVFLGTFDNILKTRTYKVGGNDYITKPFKVEEVVSKVTQQVKLLKMQKKLQLLDREPRQPSGELDAHNKALQLEVKKLQQTQEQLLNLAFYDPTTGLPNRNSFLGKIKDLLIRYQQQAEYQFAVFVLDFQLDSTDNSGLSLTELKLYLDRTENSKLLIAITQRIKSCLSRSAILSRFENNRFAIVTDKLTGGAEESKQWLSVIENRLAQPFTVVFQQEEQKVIEQQIYLKMTAGVVTNSDRYKAAHELLQDAEIALHQTQKSSSQNYHIFQPNLAYQKDTQRISPDSAPIYQRLRTHFLESVERGKVEFTYQPIFALQKNVLQKVSDVRVKGIEVFEDSQNSYQKLLILTSLFQNLEHSSVSKSIKNFTLELTAEYLKRLQEQHPSQQKLFFTMRCNESFVQQPNLSRRVKEILTLTNLEAANLHLDFLLKSEELEQPETTRLIWELADLGIKSNLVCRHLTYSKIKKIIGLPFANFKLTSHLTSQVISAEVATTLPPKDSLEVARSQQDVAKSEIARIISLAHVNNIKVIARSIKTQEQLAYLASVGCDYAQGDFLSEPLNSESLEAFLVWRV